MQLNSLRPMSVAIMVVDTESVTKDSGYTEVIMLEDDQRAREASESGHKFFCADCSAVNMVIDKRSEDIDKGYTGAISLQYDQRTKGHERRGKVEMNSCAPIVLRLTWLSIGDQMELTRPLPNRPSCSTFRARKIAQDVGNMGYLLCPFFYDSHDCLQRIGKMNTDVTTMFLVRSLSGSAIGARLWNFDWK